MVQLYPHTIRPNGPNRYWKLNCGTALTVSSLRKHLSDASFTTPKKTRNFVRLSCIFAVSVDCCLTKASHFASSNILRLSEQCQLALKLRHTHAKHSQSYWKRPTTRPPSNAFLNYQPSFDRWFSPTTSTPSLSERRLTSISHQSPSSRASFAKSRCLSFTSAAISRSAQTAIRELFLGKLLQIPMRHDSHRALPVKISPVSGRSGWNFAIHRPISNLISATKAIQWSLSRSIVTSAVKVVKLIESDTNGSRRKSARLP